MLGSTPSYQEFSPRVIPYQYKVIYDIANKFDYSLGTHEVLLSGSVGSAKSLLMAHIIIDHCIRNPRAVVGIGRLTMPSLKETLLDVIIKHLADDVQYHHNQVKGSITFSNGSRIMCFSWADKKYTKVRSYEFSMFAIEELTENKDEEFYKEIYMRVGRLKHVKTKILISATNPDEPSHWAYSRFIESDKKTVHVYYSNTLENPFLPDSYVSSLEENLDPKLAERMLFGKWVSIRQDVIYYEYEKERNFKNEDYKVNVAYPIHWSHDFNISVGKPISSVFFQHIDGVFHFFDEVIVEGARTGDACDEAHGRGLLDYPVKYIINGDATGRSNNTRSKLSDYQIIKEFLSNAKTSQGNRIDFRIEVPRSNPPVRYRHNTVNAQLHNMKGDRRVLVYKKGKTIDEGLRKTKLKEGANYIEDDNNYYQHCTTSLGYGIVTTLRLAEAKGVTMLKR